MCYCVYLASDHPFPEIVRTAKGPFSATALTNQSTNRPAIFTKPYVVELGSRTGCACSLNFYLNENRELPTFNKNYTLEIWQEEEEAYFLDKQCMVDYFAYLLQMLQLGDIEWYCCWSGAERLPPLFQEEKTVDDLNQALLLKEDHLLEEQLYILYRKH